MLCFYSFTGDLEQGGMQQKTVSIKESIPVEIYNKLLDFGNGKLEDGIENAVYLAYTMEAIQKSQINENIEIWGKIFELLKS